MPAFLIGWKLHVQGANKVVGEQPLPTRTLVTFISRPHYATTYETGAVGL